MTQDSSSPLVAEVRDIILKIFDISHQDAHQRAVGLVALAEGWGGASASHLDWSYRVKKDLGEKLNWRSDAERERFRADLEQRVNAYEGYIQRNKHT